MTKSKTAKVKAELYPLSKKEFEDLYDKAWENGWVYGKFFQELYDEYLVNWVYFVDYLDVLKGLNNNSRKYKRKKINDIDFAIVEFKNDKDEKLVKPVLIEAKDFYLDLFPKIGTVENIKEGVEEKEIISSVEILIGEAPPYWKGNAKNKDKSYFYNPKQTKNSSWLNAPTNWKKLKGTTLNTKAEKLLFLAEKGIILIDIFPFPIIQDPKVRTEITGDYKYHIEYYFLKKYLEIINYIDPKSKKTTTFKHGLVATELGALQFLCDKSIFDLDGYSYIVDNPIEFNKFTCLDSWIMNIIDMSPNNGKNQCDPSLIFHYNEFKEYYIPIVKYSNKNKKTDWSDKLKFVRKLLEIKTKTIDKDEICQIFELITKLPIFMKGQNVVFPTFINGTTK